MKAKPRENLLSAYLDGELPPARRAEIEAWLRADEAAAARIADLRRVSVLLADLPPLAAPASVVADVRAALNGFFIDPVVPPPRLEASIDAVVDGEAAPEEAADLERLAAADPEVAKRIADRTRLRDAVRSLPIVDCPPGVLDDAARTIRTHRRWRLERPVVRALRGLPNENAPKETMRAVFAAIAAEAKSARRPVAQARRESTWGVGVLLATLAAGLSGVAVFLSTPALERSNPRVAIARLPSKPMEPPVDGTAVESLAADTATSNAPASSLGSGLHFDETEYRRFSFVPETPKPIAPISRAGSTGKALAEMEAKSKVGDVRLEMMLGDAIDQLTPPTLAADRLADVKIGDLVKLNDGEIELVCVDVKQFLTRLEVVLIDNEIHRSDVDEIVAEDEAAKTATGRLAEMRRRRQGFHVVEIDATPEQIQKAFSDLSYVERIQGGLLAAVDLKPSAEIDEADAPRLAKVEPPSASAATKPESDVAAALKRRTALFRVAPPLGQPTELPIIRQKESSKIGEKRGVTELAAVERGVDAKRNAGGPPSQPAPADVDRKLARSRKFDAAVKLEDGLADSWKKQEQLAVAAALSKTAEELELTQTKIRIRLVVRGGAG
ncbi:MAG: anti-sigma factor family protein [Planctomycetia bacterium]